MAKIAKKKGKKDPPQPEEVKGNIEKDKNTTLNFKIDRNLKKEFKQYAFDEDITMHELLKKCFEHYKNR